MTLSPAGGLELTEGAVLDLRSVTRPSSLALRGGSIAVSNALIWGDHFGNDVAVGAVLLAAPVIAVTDSIISVDGYGAAPPSGVRVFGEVVETARSSITSRQFGNTPVEGLIWMEAIRQLTLDETHVDVSRSGTGPGQAFYAAARYVDLLESTIRSDQRGSGTSADVEIVASELYMSDSKIGAIVLGNGLGPGISITANSVTIGPNANSGSNADLGLDPSLDPEADIYSAIYLDAAGSSGDISIHTNQLGVLDGGRLLTANHGNGVGSAGDIRLRSQRANVFALGRSRMCLFREPSP